MRESTKTAAMGEANSPRSALVATGRQGAAKGSLGSIEASASKEAESVTEKARR